MYKDILMPIVEGEICDAAVTVASTIAAAGQGYLSVLVGVSMITPNIGAWAYYPEGYYASLKEIADATISTIAEAAEKRLTRASVPYEIRRCSSVWLTSTEMVVVAARYADLVVMGRSNTVSDAERRVFAGLLSGSGRPLLLVPEMSPLVDRFDHVVVGWKTSREAARAVHDSLPVLRRARSVDVLVVSEADERDAETASQEAKWLCHHLMRHGVETTLVYRDRDEMPADLRILDHAADSHAHLIVIGGYSHSRAREQVLGGVTRTLFEHATRPVLFSH
jgi:nucleotide-binding universal stress UspA family protein